MSVTTVKLQFPAGKPVAPPTGSTNQPLPLDVVGIVVSWVVWDVPGFHRYHPVAFCAGMLSVVDVDRARAAVHRPATGVRARGAPEVERRRVVGRRVDDVGEGELRVVELQGQPPRAAHVVEPPAQPRGGDVAPVLVEDPDRVEADVGGVLPCRVEEADLPVAADVGDEPRRELPAPRPLALALRDREELLGAPVLDDDRLGAEVRLARDSVDVPLPLGVPDVLRDDREGRALAGDRVALVVDANVDPRSGLAAEGRLGLLRAERVLEEDDVGVEATEAGDGDDGEEDGRRQRERSRRAHGGAAQGITLDARRAVLRLPQWRKVRHRFVGARSPRGVVRTNPSAEAVDGWR